MMKQLRFGSTVAAFVLFLMAGMPPAASADTVTWNLVGVTFNDGGTASGSFVYDATTNSFSSINIVTTAGTVLGGAAYMGLAPGFSAQPTVVAFITDPSLASFIGTPGLGLGFTSALTNLGGTVVLSFGTEGACFDAGCSAVSSHSPLRDTTAGEVVATPEPSTLFLLGIGFVALVGGVKRRTLPA